MASLPFSLMAAIALIFPATAQSLPNQLASWKLALHWPNSYCRNTGVQCTPSIPQDAFLIRTLFGVNEIGQQMTCSGTQPPLDPSVIAQLESTLSPYWPNLEGDNFGLWQKEWQQRAACYGINATDYFTNAVGLKLNVDLLIAEGFGSWFPGEQVFGALSLQDVHPGNTYPARTFEDVVYSKYGQNLEVLCNDDSSEENQLLEFHMCATAGYRYSLFPCPNLQTTECMKDTRYT